MDVLTEDVIFDSVACPVVVLDGQGRVVRANAASLRASGRTREGLVGRCFAELFPAAEASAVRERICGSNGSVPEAHEGEWVDAQGLPRRLSWTYSRVAGDDGQTRLIVATGSEVVQRACAEHELREHEQRLGDAFADAPIGMVLGDLEGHILRVNPAYCRITGHSERELLGQHFLNITHPDDRETNAKLVARVLAGEIPTAVMEKRYVTADGSVVWAQASAGVARQPDGRPRNYVVLVQDITERKRAEELLRESERRFRQLAEAIDGVFWMIDAESKDVLYVSPAYERLWGRSCESLYRQAESFIDVIHPDDHQRVMANLRPIPQTGFDVEYRIVRADGSERWIHDRGFPIRNERGEVYRLAGIAQDVTEHKGREQAIRSLNEHLEGLVAQRTAAAQEQSRILTSVLQSMGEAVIVADQQGNVVLTNMAAARFAGPPDPDPHSVESCAAPQHLFKSDGVTPYEGHELPLSRAVRGEAVDQEEMLIARHDVPDRVWISATARPLRDEDGKLAGGVLVARDMTERRRIDELLRESERHHREAAEHNRLLVRELEHRVRNNLAGLLGLVAVMQERVTDVRAFGKAIESRLRAMAHVQQLLAATEWRSLELRVIIDSLISAMDCLLPCAIEVALAGANVSIASRRVLPLTLILAEWLTNSCKYGAHSKASGHLSIEWDFPADSHRVRLTWEERGGPAPPDTVVPSLGTDLVQAFATRELDGVCRMTYPPEGARHELEFSTLE